MARNDGESEIGGNPETSVEIPWDPTPPEAIPREDWARLLPISTRWPGDELVLDVTPVRVGRDARAELRLRYGGLSRHHADIRYNAKTRSYFVLDLSSRNGTFVNKKKIVSHKLADGDTIHFHSEAFRFECGPSAERPPPKTGSVRRTTSSRRSNSGRTTSSRRSNPGRSQAT